MTVRHVATIGHPVLREWAVPVDPASLDDPATQAFIDDLIETMRYCNGAGLAAPQVFDSRRIVAIEVSSNPRYPYKPDIPLTVLVNPEIEPLSDETFDNNEGCLSVPNLRGVTQRFVEIAVKALDRHGGPWEKEVRGLSAVTFQHEVDHLNGKLFLDRVMDPTTLTTWEQYERFGKQEFTSRAAALVARFGS
ncbi:MAG TPA: peptide deformylase [Acidimicrobiales bacterium]|nr:peptide deformylase [Acidimicrobiales bacterium]